MHSVLGSALPIFREPRRAAPLSELNSEKAQRKSQAAVTSDSRQFVLIGYSLERDAPRQ